MKSIRIAVFVVVLILCTIVCAIVWYKKSKSFKKKTVVGDEDVEVEKMTDIERAIASEKAKAGDD